MAFDFSAITLEVIDINTNADPDLYINVNGLTFSKRILEDMNYPQYIQYCTDPAHAVFAIRSCKSNADKATPFCKPRASPVTSSLTSLLEQQLHSTSLINLVLRNVVRRHSRSLAWERAL